MWGRLSCHSCSILSHRCLPMMDTSNHKKNSRTQNIYSNRKRIIKNKLRKKKNTIRKMKWYDWLSVRKIRDDRKKLKSFSYAIRNLCCVQKSITSYITWLFLFTHPFIFFFNASLPHNLFFKLILILREEYSCYCCSIAMNQRFISREHHFERTDNWHSMRGLFRSFGVSFRFLSDLLFFILLSPFSSIYL